MKRLLFALLLVLVVTAYVQAGFKMFAPGEKEPLMYVEPDQQAQAARTLAIVLFSHANV